MFGKEFTRAFCPPQKKLLWPNNYTLFEFYGEEGGEVNDNERNGRVGKEREVISLHPLFWIYSEGKGRGREVNSSRIC